jgi:hypothetical protein
MKPLTNGKRKRKEKLYDLFAMYETLPARRLTISLEQ